MMILGAISALCAPGIFSKLVGLLKIGIAGAAPAITVGTLILQTAPLTLALAVSMLVVPPDLTLRAPLRPVVKGGVVVAYKDPPRWAERPFNTWLPLLFCTCVLTATTFISNLVGMDTGVSLSHVWADSHGHTTRALFSYGYQYLESYGLSAFASAFVIAYFLARWYRTYLPSTAGGEPRSLE